MKMLGYKAAEKRLIVRKKIDENVPKIVKGDIFRLKQIITNLTNNSIKFTKQGSVTLEIKKLEQKISYCDLKKLNIVSVKDSRGYYDLLECDSCLRIYKRYSLYTPTNLICNPKLICKKCRKEYKTEKGIGKHLELANCEAHPRR